MTAMPADTVPPTPKAMELLRVVVRWIEAHGCAPSYAELVDEAALGGKAGARRLLDQLEERGWIKRLPCRARAITVLRTPPMPEISTPTFVMSAELVERAGQ